MSCLARRMPDGTVRNSEGWSRWLERVGQPLVLVFAARWGDADRETLEAIRTELRGIGAALVVATERRAFCFRPDHDVEEQAPTELREPLALSSLHRCYGIRPIEVASGALVLTLLDEEGNLRMQSTRDAPAGYEAAVLETLRWAATNAQLGTRVLFSRREAVMLSLIGAVALSAAQACTPKSKAPAKPKAPAPAPAAREVPVGLTVNGKQHDLRLEPRVSLLDALRERLLLTGTKKGCDHGQCGACTVLLDDRRVNACLVLAVSAHGKSVTSIEGLARGEVLDPLQSAFITEDALQCGYCTPGQIMSARGLLREGRAHTDDEVREQMSGNLCRCGAYANIVKAIQRARSAVAG
jgi:xanthine dehydrogenase YagT iron-sulfur-binding subunit